MELKRLWPRAAPWLTLAGTAVLVAALFASPRIRSSQSGNGYKVKVSHGQVKSALDARLVESPDLSERLPEVKKEMEEAAVAQALLVAEAFRQGLAESDYMIGNRLAEMQVRSIYERADASVTEKMARDYYEKNRDRYVKPGRRKIVHLFVPVTNLVDEAAAKERLGRIRETRPEEESPEWVSEEMLTRSFGPSFAKKVFEAPLGEWAGPIKSGEGWHYVLVVEQETPTELTYEQVKEQVEDEVRRETRQRFYEKEIERLKSLYEVEWTD